jgi:hypothetical protein
MKPRDEHSPELKAEDAAVNRAWRDASDESPPAALDAAILAAARAASEKPRSTNAAGFGRTPATASRKRQGNDHPFTHWLPLAVAASVAGLAFLVVQLLPRDPTPSPSRTRATEEVVSSEGVAAPSSQAADAAASAETARDTSGNAGTGSSREVAGLPAPYAAPVPPPGSGVEAAASGAMPASHEAPVAAKRAMADAAAPAAMSRQNAEAQLRPDPDAWAARIEALHAAGDLDGAAASLRSFRAACDKADDYLPPTLRAWARTVE